MINYLILHLNRVIQEKYLESEAKKLNMSFIILKCYYRIWEKNPGTIRIFVHLIETRSERAKIAAF